MNSFDLLLRGGRYLPLAAVSSWLGASARIQQAALDWWRSVLRPISQL